MLIQLLLVIPISFTCIWLNSFWHKALLRRKFKRVSKTFVQLQNDWKDWLDETEEGEEVWGLPPTAYEREALRKQQRHNN